MIGRMARIFGYAKARGLYQGENPALWKHNLDEVFSIKKLNIMKRLITN